MQDSGYGLPKIRLSRHSGEWATISPTVLELRRVSFEKSAMASDLDIFAQLGIIAVVVLLLQLALRMYGITYRLTDIGVQVVCLGVFPVSTTQYRLMSQPRR